jgi:hypothetical protein
MKFFKKYVDKTLNICYNGIKGKLCRKNYLIKKRKEGLCMGLLNVKKLQDGHFLINRKIADKILSNFNYPHNRTIDSRNVQGYVNAMRKGFWERAIELSFCFLDIEAVPEEFRQPEFAINGKQYFLVNGQHRLRAVVESDTIQEVVIILKEVTDWKHLGLIYSTYDTDMRLRTRNQSITAANCVPNLIAKKGSKYFSNRAMSAINYILRNYEIGKIATSKYKLGTSEILQEMNRWEQPMIDYFDVVTANNSIKSHRKALFSPGVIAIGLVTFRCAPLYAIDFWSAVAERGNIASNDPRKVLADWLDDNITPPLGMSGEYARKHLSACAVAWNKFCQEGNITKQSFKYHIKRLTESEPFMVTLENCPDVKLLHD